jgi:hypothetical protein
VHAVIAGRRATAPSDADPADAIFALLADLSSFAGRGFVIDQSVAVVVQAVAELGVAGVDRIVIVVAVGMLASSSPAGVEAVSVEVREALVDLAVAVVVEAVAELGVAGVDLVVVVVAVGLLFPTEAAGVEAVAVEIGEPLVDRAVAVVVDTIADLERVGVDLSVAVVTVSGGDGVAVVVVVHFSSATHLVSRVADLAVVAADDLLAEIGDTTDPVFTGLTSRAKDDVTGVSLTGATIAFAGVRRNVGVARPGEAARVTPARENDGDAQNETKPPAGASRRASVFGS